MISPYNPNPSPSPNPKHATRLIRAQVLLLDEATSALDLETALLVEQLVLGCGAASVWITHDLEQAERMGGCRVSFVQTAS